MSPELIQKIIELDQFDCKEHHCFEEIGDYDGKAKTFQKVKDFERFDEDDLERIKKDRELYVGLVELRNVNFESSGYSDKNKIFEKAMMLEKFGLTTKQICQKLKIFVNFLRANREEYKADKN